MQDEIDEILKHLKSNLKQFDKNNSFSIEPGIYAIGINSTWEFSLNSKQIIINPKEIIYIGKTESNQISRDVKTHFESGKTGSSTLRRSLGSILRKDLNLKPIPRSCTENGNRRFTNYKFISKDEEKLTKWMVKNLSISYYEWNGTIENLQKMETKIIKQLCPILNLQNNPDNTCKSEIKRLRKQCRNLAKENKNHCK